MPSAMTTISANFAPIMIVRLLILSASQPATPENKRNATAKMIIASAWRSGAISPAAFAAASSTAVGVAISSRSCLKRLSLNAPRNCVTDMPKKDLSLSSGGRSPSMRVDEGSASAGGSSSCCSSMPRIVQEIDRRG